FQPARPWSVDGAAAMAATGRQHSRDSPVCPFTACQQNQGDPEKISLRTADFFENSARIRSEKSAGSRKISLFSFTARLAENCPASRTKSKLTADVADTRGSANEPRYSPTPSAALLVPQPFYARSRFL